MYIWVFHTSLFWIYHYCVDTGGCEWDSKNPADFWSYAYKNSSLTDLGHLEKKNIYWHSLIWITSMKRWQVSTSHTYKCCRITLLVQYSGKSSFIRWEPPRTPVPKKNTVLRIGCHAWRKTTVFKLKQAILKIFSLFRFFFLMNKIQLPKSSTFLLYIQYAVGHSDWSPEGYPLEVPCCKC